MNKKYIAVVDLILQGCRFFFKGTRVQNWGVSSILYEKLMKIRAKPNPDGDFTIEFQNAIFHMEPSDITILPTVISGEYEKTEIAWLKNQIAVHQKQRIIFIDVGANVGIYTLIVAKLLKVNDHVWSIEPDPRNLKRLKKNIQENGINKEMISILETGIGKENGTANFHLSRFGGVSQIATVSNTGSYKIPIRTLDDLLFDQLDNNSQLMIKIDVEGFEDSVLCGAINIISKFKPDLIIEIFPYAKNLDQKTVASLASLYDTAEIHVGGGVIDISHSLQHSLDANRNYGNLTLSSRPEN